MDSGSLVRLREEVRKLYRGIDKYKKLVDTLAYAIRLVPDTPQGFRDRERADLIECLEHAAAILDGTQPTPYAINTDIVAAKNLIASTPVYVEKRQEEKLADVAPKPVEKPFKVLRKWTEWGEDYHTGQYAIYWEDRMYSADDPDGQYQRWKWNKRYSTFTPDGDYIKKYIDPLQAVKIETLLDTLDTLNM